MLARTTQEVEVRGPKGVRVDTIFMASGVEVEVSEATVQIPPSAATLAVGRIPGIEGYVILTSDNCEAVASEADGDDGIQ